MRCCHYILQLSRSLAGVSQRSDTPLPLSCITVAAAARWLTYTKHELLSVLALLQGFIGFFAFVMGAYLLSTGLDRSVLELVLMLGGFAASGLGIVGFITARTSSAFPFSS